MKVAICLFGNTGFYANGTTRTFELIKQNIIKQTNVETKLFKNLKISPEQGYLNLKKKFIDKYNTDVFIHCWDKENEKLLKKLYNPKKFIIEEQRDFPTNLKKYGIIVEKDIDQWNCSSNAKLGYKRALVARGNMDFLIKECKIASFRLSSCLYSKKKFVN